MSSLLEVKHIEIWKEGSQTIKEFVPRIPGNRAMGEDGSIPRICASTTIENCVKASPRTSYIFFGMLDDINLLEMSFEYFHWFLETAQYGMIVRVYHFEVDEAIAKHPKEIHKSGWVPDALITEEYWIMQNVKPVRISYAIVNRESDEDYKLKIVEESDSLEGLGVFVNCEILEHYRMVNGFNDNSIDFKQPMTYADALSFKSKIENDSDWNVNHFEEEVKVDIIEPFQPYTGDLDDSDLPF